MATQAKLEVGAAFLTVPVTEASFLTPEKFTDEQKLIQESAATFIEREVLPKAEEIRHQEEGLMASLVRKAGEQGLLMIDVPEEYGGADYGFVVIFFFQAEDGIRDLYVTGVQTCALPI